MRSTRVSRLIGPRTTLVVLRCCSTEQHLEQLMCTLSLLTLKCLPDANFGSLSLQLALNEFTTSHFDLGYKITPTCTW